MEPRFELDELEVAEEETRLDDGDPGKLLPLRNGPRLPDENELDDDGSGTELDDRDELDDDVETEGAEVEEEELAGPTLIGFSNMIGCK